MIHKLILFLVLSLIINSTRECIILLIQAETIIAFAHLKIHVSHLRFITLAFIHTLTYRRKGE